LHQITSNFEYFKRNNLSTDFLIKILDIPCIGNVVTKQTQRCFLDPVDLLTLHEIVNK